MKNFIIILTLLVLTSTNSFAKEQCSKYKKFSAEHRKCMSKNWKSGISDGLKNFKANFKNLNEKGSLADLFKKN